MGVDQALGLRQLLKDLIRRRAHWSPRQRMNPSCPTPRMWTINLQGFGQAMPNRGRSMRIQGMSPLAEGLEIAV